MKKIFLTVTFALLMNGMCFAAVSDDVYVRKDVFEVYMQNINANMERILGEIKEMRQIQAEQAKTISALSEKVDGNYASLSEKIDGNYASLSNRMDGLEARMDDFRNYLYWMIVLLGIVVAVPSVQKFWQWKTEHKPSITLEDVQRLIRENNAELLKTLRA